MVLSFALELNNFFMKWHDQGKVFFSSKHFYHFCNFCFILYYFLCILIFGPIIVTQAQRERERERERRKEKIDR